MLGGGVWVEKPNKRARCAAMITFNSLGNYVFTAATPPLMLRMLVSKPLLLLLM
jgi:hypothetical protein